MVEGMLAEAGVESRVMSRRWRLSKGISPLPGLKFLDALTGPLLN